MIVYGFVFTPKDKYLTLHKSERAQSSWMFIGSVPAFTPLWPTQKNMYFLLLHEFDISTDFYWYFPGDVFQESGNQELQPESITLRAFLTDRRDS